jgi:hypothetical protein
VLIVGCLSGALKLRGSGALELSLFAHHKHHRTLNWKTHEGRWINGPRLPNIQRLIFTTELRASGVPDCPNSQSSRTAKSLDCCSYCQVQSHITPGMPRGVPRHRGDVIIPHHIRCFGTSELRGFGTSEDFFLPLNHEPFLPECQVFGPWDLMPRVPCDQRLRLTPAFGPLGVLYLMLTSTLAHSNSLER